MKENKHKVDCALEEFAPNRFLIHDTRVMPFLRGEGIVTGNRFELQSWRREGLFGRIEQRGMLVLSLEEQIASLPPLPRLPAVADSLIHLASMRERWSIYDPATRVFVACEAHDHMGQQIVTIKHGALLSRRSGRSAAAFMYCRPHNQRRYELQALTADKAVWFMLAQSQGVAPALKVFRQPDATYTCQLPELPADVQTICERFATYQRSTAQWTFTDEAASLIDAVMQHIGVELVVST